VKVAASSPNTVLVALLPTVADWTLVRDKGIYRIPVRTAPKSVSEGTLTHIAFYFPMAFGAEACTIRWYAPINSLVIRKRREVLPDQPMHPNADSDYFIVGCRGLQELPRVIPSRKPRRLLFIPTTMKKLLSAPEINFLFSDSPLEELLWTELLRAGIPSERQFDITVGPQRFKLDFAVFCKECNIDIECDGDKYHMSPDAVERDKRRSNALTSHGWADLRFTTTQLTTGMAATMSLVSDTINRYGGLQDPDDPNQYRYVKPPNDPQPRLFG
jgi:very-short-patch-repair endonuclease